MKLSDVDLTIIKLLRRSFLPLARIAIFVVFFWFGALKLFDLSPASPLAEALMAKTVGIDHFSLVFKVLGLYECIVGILFLFPRLTRMVIPLLLIHLIVVCSPLLLVPDLAWNRAFVPTLEGQYIIKNIVVVALAIGIAAQTQPLSSLKRS